MRASVRTANESHSGYACTMHVHSLHVYPLKSAEGLSPARVSLGPLGLDGDRTFAVVEQATGEFVSQRTQPKLARVVTRLGTTHLEIDVPGYPTSSIARASDPEAPPLEVTVWDDRVTAEDVGDEAAGTLSAFLGFEVRVARFGSRTVRPVDPRYAGPDDHATFADGFPVLVTSTGSLREVARETKRIAPGLELDMKRFRPNVVLDGLEAFEEDTLDEVHAGEVVLRLVKPCARCLMVDVDPATGEPDRGVLKALARVHTIGSNVIFGQNALVVRSGVLAVGDEVRVVRA